MIEPVELIPEDQQDLLLIRMTGKPDGFLNAFESLVEPGRQVVLDLAAAGPFKGDDLEDLVWAHNRCVENGGGFVLTNLAGDLTFILNLLELDQFFEIRDTADAGADLLRARQAPMSSSTERMVALRKELIQATEPYNVDPEGAARLQIAEIKTSMPYVAPSEARIDLLSYLVTQGTNALDSAQAALYVGQDQKTIEQALLQLRALGIVVHRGGALRFFPKPRARAMIADILDLWQDQANRAKLMDWAAV